MARRQGARRARQQEERQIIRRSKDKKKKGDKTKAKLSRKKARPKRRRHQPPKKRAENGETPLARHDAAAAAVRRPARFSRERTSPATASERLRPRSKPPAASDVKPQRHPAAQPQPAADAAQGAKPERALEPKEEQPEERRSTQRRRLIQPPRRALLPLMMRLYWPRYSQKIATVPRAREYGLRTHRNRRRCLLLDGAAGAQSKNSRSTDKPRTPADDI
ncbi:hypothetical protein niasHT_035685 [Heterodera trifolii]|uniref:Uncharacterized protein n=1 Tax=Heterodera trifolii TaxID=157864 RepID=A0ABD2I9I0_9BILA